MLETLVALLAAVAVAVPISRRLGLGSILGYLVAGLVIGPHGLRLVVDIDQIQEIAELGVVMLLFLIGLEVRPQRLWVMRRAVFGIGLLQLLITALVIGAALKLGGIPWPACAALGIGLSLSSTAIALPILAERDLLPTRGGRDAFAVLLFQDLAFIPLVALLPLLGAPDLARHIPQIPWTAVGLAVAVIIAILIGGRFVVPWIFRGIGGVRLPEVFTATALLLVIGTAFIANSVGLSMSLGAFMAGVLMSDSAYRHQLHADIEPFEGLLLGFFFMSVGMNTNLELARDHPLLLALGVPALLATKILVMFLLARLSRRDRISAIRFAVALPAGSEFGFVLFAAATGAGVMTDSQGDFATLMIAATMALAPMLFALSEAKLIPRLKPRLAAPAFDKIDEPPSAVIICGFGRVGQIVGRVLRMRGIGFVALEKSQTQLDILRRFGSKVYFGDPSRAEVLRAAGADTAKLLVIAVDHGDEAVRIAEIARESFPHLTVISRARNRREAHVLMDNGVDRPARETFYSSLKLAEMALKCTGAKTAEARAAVTLFADHDERLLLQQHGFYKDEKRLIQSSQEAADELESILSNDTKPAIAAE
jgi:CPA2 family monovalent cation:H+ antiporter-2/glutathione-regulated potassium-efflux system protein KefB